MRDGEKDIIFFIIAVTAYILLLIGFLLVILVLYRRKQVSYQRNLETLRANYEKNMLKTQLEIQEQTFHHISQEIHDNIGLSLTLAKLNLNTVDLAKPGETAGKIDSSVDLISKSIADLSDISKSLDSEVINEQGFLRAVEREIDRLQKTGLYKVDYRVTGEPVYMDAQQELILFRVVQECLNNILKHAKAKTIRIGLGYDTSLLRLEISDDGIGFSETALEQKKKNKAMAGLGNIRERSKLINGGCTIDSTPGAGTRIRITVPY